MSTEDDLKRLGQAAAALAGVAAGRAKQVAEQLLGPRDREREEAKRRGSGLVEEGKHAAADVVSALRREASVILHDLEHLEQTLRAREGGGPGATTTAETALEPAKAAPAKRTGAAKATKTASAGKPAGTGTADESAAKPAAPRAKASGARKAAGPRKATGGPARPSSEERG
jgi:heparin binding hemagglutinin HbhA